MKTLASVMDNENEQAFLPNSHIVKMLKKEFGICIKTKNELEIDIYMNIMKKSLKSWPHWNVLDEIVKTSKIIEGYDLDKALNNHCSHLKQYLGYSLKYAEDEMKPRVEEYKKKLERQKRPHTEVAMEIKCSRQQLNHLVYRHPQPHPLSQNTMFTISETDSKIICVEEINLKYVLNCPNVMISITLPGFECMRHNTSNIEYTLVNLKKKGTFITRDLNEKFNVKNIYFKKSDTKADNLSKQCIIDYIKQLQSYIENYVKNDNKPLNMEYALTILNEFMLDVSEAPNILTPGEYQYYLNKHKYTRKLYHDVPETDIFIGTKNYKNCFDMHIEELLTPMQRFSFTLINPSKIAHATKCMYNDTIPWLKIKCLSCGIEFELFYLIFDEVFRHFAECQGTAPDWECTGCAKKFTTHYLTNNRWSHKCRL